MAEENLDNSTQEGSGGTTGSDAAQSLPPASFITVIQTFAVQALIHLGAIPNPMGDKLTVDLDMARFNIHILEVLKEKTAGNLSQQEEAALGHILHETRMVFVQTSGEKDSH